MEDGSPVLIIDVDDLVRSIDNLLKGGRLHKLKDARADSSGKKKKVLVVDDSITVREVERNLLSSKGYDVETAVDGADGWNALRTGNYDLVVTDVDMPRMNGFELVERIKKHEKLKDIPVMIVSYKDREEDKIKGIDAGANYYLTKSSFHDNTLIDAVYNLIGEPGL
jgi:two-component system sensor histidine kinase and response regulator WspE